MTNCGTIADDCCCTSLEVPGGTFYRTFDGDIVGGAAPMTTPDGGPTQESDPATVSDFRLDKYLVTVGRFRQFVHAWNGGAGYTPPAGSGKHTHLNGGQGLANSDWGIADSGDVGMYETGWSTSWNADIDLTNAKLASCSPASSWTNEVGSQENLPISCVNWYDAYAFCIWDGGFLPSEAEWGYAAAGGSQQREYPWGSTDPGMSNQYAIYNCCYPSGSCNGEYGCGTTGVSNIAPVGTATLGAALWGQLDMAGDVWEWALDCSAAYVNPCTDCARLTLTSDFCARRVRGGAFGQSLWSLPSASFFYLAPNEGTESGGDIIAGFRCARTP